MAAEETEWRQYEKHIYEQLKKWAGSDPDARVEFDRKLPGQLSGTTRQIDALVTGRFAGGVEKEVTAAVDCKHYTRNLDVTHVEAFIGLVEDVQTDMGLLITNRGYSPAAQRRAQRGIKLQVVVSHIDELSSYSPAYDEPYYEGDYYDFSPYGPVGATIRYCEPYETEYTPLPDEVEWSDEVLASGTDDELSWGDDRSRTACARIVLRHRLGRDPSLEEVQDFVNEIASHWDDGYPWVLFTGDLSRKLGL